MVASTFDNGNFYINSKFWDKHSKEMGKMMMYYLVLVAKHSPYQARKDVRQAVGISRATEWRYRKKLRERGYL